jgi:hypothetical protein
MLHNVFARLLDSTSLPAQRTSSSTTIKTALHRNKNNRAESKQEQPHRIKTRTTRHIETRTTAPQPHRIGTRIYPHRIESRMNTEKKSITRMGIRGSISPWGARRRHRVQSRRPGGRGSRSGRQQILGQRRHRGRRTAPPGVPAGSTPARRRVGADPQRENREEARRSRTRAHPPHTTTKP